MVRTMTRVLFLVSVLFLLCLATTCTAGHVVRVLDVVNGTIVPNVANMKTVFSSLDPETEVAVIAIGGEFRKGKSFLMNFFLQYLSQRKSHAFTPARDEDQLQQMIEDKIHPWLRDMDRNTGFQFKAGTERFTTGITMWSKPFVITKADGKQLAVLLMDSQGLYDASTSHDDNVRLFTIVSLLSSSLMLNVPQNVNLMQLLELKYFMDYATSGSKLIEGHKPFQRLTFVVRDFTLAETYGWDGGKRIIDQYMLSNENQTKGLVANLTRGFQKIDAFVTWKQSHENKFDGSLKKIEPEFLLHVERLVANISEEVKARTPLLMPLTAGTFVQYLINASQVFNAKDSPKELMQMNEREIVSKVNAVCNQAILSFENELEERVKNSDALLNMTESQVREEIDELSKQIAQTILHNMASNSSASVSWIPSFKLTRDWLGRSITALQFTSQGIESRYQSLQTPMLNLVKLRKAEAEVAEAKKRASGLERKKLEIQRIVLINKQRYLEAELEQERCIAHALWNRGFFEKLGDLFGVASPQIDCPLRYDPLTV